MNRFVHLCLAATAVAGLASACSVLPIKTHLGGDSSSSSPSSQGPLSPPVGADRDHVDRTRELYQRFTYQNLTSSEADRLFSSAGIPSTFNPRNKMKNPDPAWIPGWDALSLTDETKTAILQAAVNRTWQAQVHEDYQRYRATWDRLKKELRPRLAKATAISDYYEQGAALLALYAEVRERATAAKVFYEAGEYAFVGFTSDIVRAMAELHRTARTEFLLGVYLARAGVSLAQVRETARALASDEIERDVFTQYSRRFSNLDSPKLPVMAEYGNAFQAIRWPVSRERVADIERARAKLVADHAAAFSSKHQGATIPALLGGSSQGDPSEPTLRWIQGQGEYKPVVVTKVTRKGAGAVVVLESSRARSVPYACKDTNQLDTTGSGRLYVQSCKYKHHVTRYRMTTTFPALPAGLTLAPGDELAFYGDVVRKTEVTSGWQFEITARVLQSVTRNGTPIATYW